MIKVNIKRSNGNINNIRVSGHANYAPSGSDIVCASVSTAMYLSANLLVKVNKDNEFTEDEKATIMELKITHNDDMSMIIVDNLLGLLKNLEEDYPKFIKIKEN